MDNGAFDSLASNGIINFDADAYIKGTAPRYVGSPNNSNGMPFEQPLNTSYYPGLGARLPQQPGHDQFHHEAPKRMDWKEVLALGVIGSLVVAGGVKCKNQIKKLFTKKTKTKATPPPPPAPVAAAPAKPKAGAKITAKFKEAFEWFKKNKAAKITAGVGLGLLALYGIYDVVIKGKARAQEGAEASEAHPNPSH